MNFFSPPFVPVCFFCRVSHVAYARYHGSQAVVISALQVQKHPFITPGPGTPPPTRHSTLPGVSQGMLASILQTGSLPHHYSSAFAAASSSMTPILGGAKDGVPSVCSSGYPTPRPGSAASGFDYSLSIGSPQIGAPGSLFRSFPKPHSSPKMKLRFRYGSHLRSSLPRCRVASRAWPVDSISFMHRNTRVHILRLKMSYCLLYNYCMFLCIFNFDCMIRFDGPFRSTNRRIELSYQSRKSPDQPRKSDGGTYHVIKAGVT